MTMERISTAARWAVWGRKADLDGRLQLILGGLTEQEAYDLGDFLLQLGISKWGRGDESGYLEILVDVKGAARDTGNDYQSQEAGRITTAIISGGTTEKKSA